MAAFSICLPDRKGCLSVVERRVKADGVGAIARKRAGPSWWERIESRLKFGNLA